MHRVGGVVGQDRDLGGSGLGVDSDLRTADALGGGDVDVARPGDHVHRREFGAVGVGAAVGQQRHGLRPADRPHLVDPQQRRGGQDGRVRQAVERDPARRPAAGWRSPASRRRRSGPAPRSSPRWTDRPRCRPARRGPTRSTGTHRSVTVAPGGQLGGGVGAALVGVHGPGACDRHLEGGPHLGVEVATVPPAGRRPARARSRGARRRTTRRTRGPRRHPGRRPRRRSGAPWAPRCRRRRRRAAGRHAAAPRTGCDRAGRFGTSRSQPSVQLSLIGPAE